MTVTLPYPLDPARADRRSPDGAIAVGRLDRVAGLLLGAAASAAFVAGVVSAPADRWLPVGLAAVLAVATALVLSRGRVRPTPARAAAPRTPPPPRRAVHHVLSATVVIAGSARAPVDHAGRR